MKWIKNATKINEEWRGGEERGGKGKEKRGKERTGEVRGGTEKKGSQRGEATVQRQPGGGLINLKGGDLLGLGSASIGSPRSPLGITFVRFYKILDPLFSIPKTIEKTTRSKTSKNQENRPKSASGTDFIRNFMLFEVKFRIQKPYFSQTSKTLFFDDGTTF